MSIAIFVAFLLASIYVAITAVSQYAAATGTAWQRLLAAAQGSATILWAKFCIAVASFAGLLSQAADYLNEPSLNAAIQAALKPEYVAAFTIFVMVVSIWARKRTL